MALTKRQREILDYVRLFIRENGYSPSLEEIGRHFGLSSVATVHKHVQHLVQKGQLRKAWNRSRSVEPVEPGDAEAGVEIPLLGTVAAGNPIAAIEVPEKIAVPEHLLRNGTPVYALRVAGNSMIEEQIRDGDTVIVESRQEARDGETVVALIRGEEATLKKLYRKGDTVRLMPANPDMEPIDVPARDVEVRGVVTGLLRAY
ncbi:MAG: transcriptional repressor LexA [Myxococcales bacterium]|nr:transcriptional repressor LexA [Myxococcales bacterium]